MAQSPNIDLTQIILDAEQAVSNIADSELKKIAFDRVLERLLQTGSVKSREGVQEVGHSKDRNGKDNSSKPGPKTWIRELVNDGFFKTPKTNSAIRTALDERGHILKATDLTNPLASLVNEQVLRRKKMPAEDGGKDQVHWHNW